MSYKSLLYLVRAYFDAVYVALTHLASKRTRTYGSMADALKADDPVGQVLRAKLPTFLAWFATWRYMRNEVKQGRDFVIAGSGDDVGIGFVAFRESNDKIMIAGSDRYLRLTHVTQALVHGRAVTELISSLVASRRNPANEGP